jgi:hypothetical protein
VIWPIFRRDLSSWTDIPCIKQYGVCRLKFASFLIKFYVDLKASSWVPLIRCTRFMAIQREQQVCRTVRHLSEMEKFLIFPRTSPGHSRRSPVEWVIF